MLPACKFMFTVPKEAKGVRSSGTGVIDGYGCCVGAGNQTWVPCTCNECCNPLSSFSAVSHGPVCQVLVFLKLRQAPLIWWELCVGPGLCFLCPSSPRAPPFRAARAVYSIHQPHGGYLNGWFQYNCLPNE